MFPHGSAPQQMPTASMMLPQGLAQQQAVTIHVVSDSFHEGGAKKKKKKNKAGRSPNTEIGVDENGWIYIDFEAAAEGEYMTTVQIKGWGRHLEINLQDQPMRVHVNPDVGSYDLWEKPIGSGNSMWIRSSPLLENPAETHPCMQQVRVTKKQRPAGGEKESAQPDSPAKTAKKNLKEKKGDENGFRAAGGENGSPEPDSPDVWNKSPEEERLSLSAFVEALKFVEAQWEEQRRTNPPMRHCIYCGVYEPFAQDGTDLSCRNKDCVFID